MKNVKSDIFMVDPLRLGVVIISQTARLCTLLCLQSIYALRTRIRRVGSMAASCFSFCAQKAKKAH